MAPTTRKAEVHGRRPDGVESPGKGAPSLDKARGEEKGRGRLYPAEFDGELEVVAAGAAPAAAPVNDGRANEGDAGSLDWHGGG